MGKLWWRATTQQISPSCDGVCLGNSGLGNSGTGHLMLTATSGIMVKKIALDCYLRCKGAIKIKHVTT
eukprot:804591-Pelagomonas_calceolata.AAC.7